MLFLLYAIVFRLCCFMSIPYKQILSNIQIEYNGYLVLQHNHVLLNMKDILVLGEKSRSFTRRTRHKLSNVKLPIYKNKEEEIFSQGLKVAC